MRADRLLNLTNLILRFILEYRENECLKMYDTVCTVDLSPVTE